MNNPIAEKAIVVDIKISCWSGHRFDREVSEEVNTARGAAEDAGRYNKQLLPRRAFAELYAITREARRIQAELTLPWSLSGGNLLPNVSIDKFYARWRPLLEDWEKAVTAFERNYPRWKAEAKTRLNGMYKESDYPKPERLRSLFRLEMVPTPVQTTDFRCKVSAEQMEDLQRDAQRHIEESLREAMKNPVERVIHLVGRMAERLKNYQPGTDEERAQSTFRDSLVNNIRELVDALPALNLTNDKKLASITTAMSKELCKHDADYLRDNEDARATVAKAADAILKQAEALMS